MALKNVPLFGLGNEGRSRNVSAQSRVNLYAELHDDPESNGVTLYPTAGLRSVWNFGASPVRGAYEKGSSLYVVAGSTVYEAIQDGSYVSRGTLGTSTGRVDMADNGTQLLIVDGTDTGYTYTYATTTLATIADTDFPRCDTCTFLNGYGIVQSDSGQFFISAPYDFTSWDALDFATAESDPDNLVRVRAFLGQLLLFGTKTTEPWGDSGAADFPFARIGASAVQWGLAARWSLAEFSGGLAFLAKNQQGAVQVFLYTGGQVQPLSKPEMEAEVNGYTTVSDATAYSYMVGGHPFYQINFPTADVSWEYDGQSKEWHKRQSGMSGRHVGELQVNFLDKPYVSDAATGQMYQIDPTVYTDNGQTIVREFITRHNKTGEYSHIAQLWIEMEAGVGLTSGQGSDPIVTLQISRDGGNTWGRALQAKVGKIGQRRTRAVWNNLGRSRDWVFKFRVTDPVKTVFVAGWAKVAT